MTGRKTGHRRTDADGGESELGDRRIDNTLVAELFPESASDFIRTVVFRDFFTHDEYVLVSQDFFTQRLVQSVANC